MSLISNLIFVTVFSNSVLILYGEQFIGVVVYRCIQNTSVKVDEIYLKTANKHIGSKIWRLHSYLFSFRVGGEREILKYRAEKIFVCCLPCSANSQTGPRQITSRSLPHAQAPHSTHHSHPVNRTKTSQRPQKLNRILTVKYSLLFGGFALSPLTLTINKVRIFYNKVLRVIFKSPRFVRNISIPNYLCINPVTAFIFEEVQIDLF